MKSNKPKQEKTIPEFLLKSMNNCNDLLSHLNDESRKELGWSLDNTELTILGIWMNLTNRDNKKFPVIVCPEEFTNSDYFRRKIYECGKSVEENFPEVIHKLTPDTYLWDKSSLK